MRRRRAPLRSRGIALRPGLLAIVLVIAALSLAGLATGAPQTSAAEPAASPAARDAGGTWWHAGADGAPRVDLWVGYSSTCPHCQAAAPRVKALAAELGWLDVHWLQVNGGDADAAIATVAELAAMVGGEFRGVPVFFYAGRMRTGWADDGSSLWVLQTDLEAFRDALRHPAAVASPEPSPPPDTAVALPFVGTVEATSISLPLLAVTLGGLDALNPCALSVLLFLMSVLAGSRDRRRMLLVGGTFVAVSGIVYFALMAAWLNVFLVFGALRIVTVVAGVAAIVAAAINLKDHVWFRRGISLVIPESARPAIFGRVLDLSEATALRVLLPTTVLVAGVANLYEMLCTGGFPVVFTRVLTLADLPTLAYYGYLALYCVVYVVPAAIIVAVFTLTLGTRGITVDQARDLKLLSGLLMLGFGSMLLLAPDLLTDLRAAVGLLVGAVTAWLVILLLERLTGARATDHHRGRPAGDTPG